MIQRRSEWKRKCRQNKFKGQGNEQQKKIPEKKKRHNDEKEMKHNSHAVKY